MGKRNRMKQAVVCEPGKHFADGLSTADLGRADLVLALEQHRKYCEALEDDGIGLIRIPPADHYPDSTFVEDTCVITGNTAVITRPGHPSRQGEEDLVAKVLAAHFPLARITAPGLLDGGDVLVAEDRMFIGLSRRTNREGALQLAGIAEQEGLHPRIIPVREGLHLKSGVNYLGDGIMLLTQAWRVSSHFGEYKLLVVPPEEEYAANAVRLNSTVLVAAGFPRTRDTIVASGLEIRELEMTEFMKMDGGLSCLSVRW